MSENGHESGKRREVELKIIFDYETGLVSVDAPDKLPIMLAQMMVDEAGRFLDLQRRQMVTQQIIKQAEERKAAADFARGVVGLRH